MKNFFLCIALVFFSMTAFGEEPNPLQVLYEEGVKAYAAKDYQRARELFEKTVQIYPKLAASYNYLGLIHKDLGDNIEVVKENFQKAIEADPRFAPAYDNLGKTYYSIADYAKAEENCLKSLELDPQATGTKLSLAWIYLIGKSDPHQAISYFNKAIKENGEIPYAYFGLGMAYFMTDDRSKILGIITKLRKMNEEDLAKELEHMVRDNRYVPITAPGMPLRSAVQQQPATIVKDVPVQSTPTPPEKKKPARPKKPAPALSPENNEAPPSGAERIRQLQKKGTSYY